MQKSPKDKMIKQTPRTKKAAAKPVEVEVEKVETGELSASDQKSAQEIARVITHEDNGIEVFKRLTRGQIDLIKRTVAKGATDDELKLFLQVCAGAQLNPFLRQVHLVKRWDSKLGQEVGAIQVGIDGFRAIAEGSGQYAGSDDAVMRDEKDIQVNSGKDATTLKVPGSATVTVYKLMEGSRYPFTATARWEEYYPGDKQGYMWKKMPYGQLAKCAEALALRKAFPKLLSGLYAPEEMEQAGGGGGKPEADDNTSKTIKFIGTQNSMADLEELRDKVKTSDKYTEADKLLVFKTINERIKEILPEQNMGSEKTPDEIADSIPLPNEA